MREFPRQCLYCGQRIIGRRRTRRYCDAYCRLRDWRMNQGWLAIDRMLDELEQR